MLTVSEMTRKEIWFLIILQGNKFPLSVCRKLSVQTDENIWRKQWGGGGG